MIVLGSSGTSPATRAPDTASVSQHLDDTGFSKEPGTVLALPQPATERGRRQRGRHQNYLQVWEQRSEAQTGSEGEDKALKAEAGCKSLETYTRTETVAWTESGGGMRGRSVKTKKEDRN